MEVGALKSEIERSKINAIVIHTWFMHHESKLMHVDLFLGRPLYVDTVILVRIIVSIVLNPLNLYASAIMKTYFYIGYIL